jgi:HNH endonuclease
MGAARPIAERFWEKVDVGDPFECWPWKAARKRNGYGQFAIDSRLRGECAHRVAYLLTYGPYDASLYVMHRCDNPPCVNPMHLFLGTAAENTADMMRKGRDGHGVVRGAQSPRAVPFTDEDVHAIRQSSESGLELARRYGVGSSTIYRVRRGLDRFEAV